MPPCEETEFPVNKPSTKPPGQPASEADSLFDMRRLSRILHIPALVIGGVLALGALGVGTLAPIASGPAPAAAKAPTYYVSLGDSYSVGYQPGLGATPGYAAYVANHTHLTLANFGCAGATTSSLLTAIGCPAVLPHTAGGMAYPTTTQIAAADRLHRRAQGPHRAHHGVDRRQRRHRLREKSNPVACVATATAGIKINVRRSPRNCAPRRAPRSRSSARRIPT